MRLRPRLAGARGAADGGEGVRGGWRVHSGAPVCPTCYLKELVPLCARSFLLLLLLSSSCFTTPAHALLLLLYFFTSPAHALLLLLYFFTTPAHALLLLLYYCLCLYLGAPPRSLFRVCVCVCVCVCV
jgi:hypothetical protein